jgi:hypothetical protein
LRRLNFGRPASPPDIAIIRGKFEWQFKRRGESNLNRRRSRTACPHARNAKNPLKTGTSAMSEKERSPFGNRSLFAFDNHEPQQQFAARSDGAISQPAPAA